MSNDDFYMRCSDDVMRKVLKYQEIGACLVASHEEVVEATLEFIERRERS